MSDHRNEDDIALEMFQSHFPGYGYSAVDRAIYLQYAREAIASGVASWESWWRDKYGDWNPSYL